MSGVADAIFGSEKSETQSSSSNTKTNTTTQHTPFSGDALTNYNDYLGAAKNNYNTMSNNITNMMNSGKLAGDTSWLKESYNNYKNMDNSLLNNLNTGSVNPNDNADWVNAQNAIDSNARKGFGSTLDQVNQNIIGKGMANGSGHQSAAYNAAANMESTLASDRAKRWTDQYNQNTQNVLKANGQLSDFYQKLSDIGVDYAKLTQEDMTTLLNAYNQQNDALKNYGTAVALGSNPTTTTNSETNGTTNGTSTFHNTPSLWEDAMAVGGFFA